MFRQGDAHHAGSPADGVVARQQIADVLVASLTSPGAVGKTFELVAEVGPATTALEPLFTALPADAQGALDGPSDADSMPLDAEPQAVKDDLSQLQRALGNRTLRT